MEVEKITCAVEKTDPINKAKMGSQHIRLVEMGLEVAHTITTHEGNVYVQHSNMVVEIKRLTGVTDEKTILRAEQSRAEQSRAEQLDCSVIQVGSVANQIESTRNNPQRQRVYDTDGLSPTLNCMQGGGLQPHIVDVKKIGSVEEMKDIKTIGNIYPDNPHQSGSVYDGDGIAPTLQSGTHSYGIPFIMEEKQIVAMRGRNPEDPSDRTPGVELEQRLEPNTQGICNTVTSVQKDNLVLETALMDAEGIRMVRTEEGKALRKAYESGEIHHGFNEYREPEVREDGVSNTITTVPKDTEIVETRIVAIDEQNMAIREDTFGTLTTDGSSPKHNNRVGELKKIKVRQATKEGFVEVELGGVVDLNYPTSDTRRGRAIENGQICPTLTTENIPSVVELGDEEFWNFVYEIDGDLYLIRIRKLIPLECGRLMGVTDDDIEKMISVESNSQTYKAFGNSICCNVLEAIFSQMNISGVKPWNEMSIEEKEELTKVRKKEGALHGA